MTEGSVSWRCPSNIALVKYWGKHGIQLPANPSISFSLSESHTTTMLSWRPKDERSLEFYFEGQEKPEFLPKIETFFKRVESMFPFVKEHSLRIESENSFPHSSGIASSASAMSALAMCLCEWESVIEGKDIDFEKASEAARLGSGSACRSVYGGFALWGETEHLSGSSDRFARSVPEIHVNFTTLQDTILLIDEGVKEVSSTVGHGLMNGHMYASQRFDQARGNIKDILSVLKGGDFNAMAELMEQEALSLHAMMMTSKTPYLLMRPGTLEVISRIMARRKQGSPVSFTLDAGANVHMIYPSSYVDKAMEFISSELVDFCANGAYICDKVGTGPQNMVLQR